MSVGERRWSTVFRVLKRQFDYVEVRDQGCTRNATQMLKLFAPSYIRALAAPSEFASRQILMPSGQLGTAVWIIRVRFSQETALQTLPAMLTSAFRFVPNVAMSSMACA